MKSQTENFHENKSVEKIQIWLKSGWGGGDLTPYTKALVRFISAGDIKCPETRSLSSEMVSSC
jgi:hypothetical protein